MKLASISSRLLARSFHTTSYHRRTALEAVQAFSKSTDAVADFRNRAFQPGKPIVFRKSVASPTTSLPAFNSWFPQDGGANSIAARLQTIQSWPFPYELMSTSPQKQEAIEAFRDWLSQTGDMTDQILAGILQASMTEAPDSRFFQLHAPLQLLNKAMEFNAHQISQNKDVVELYIAQSSLSDLPEELRGDLATPELVLKAGKGDVYNSSIWLGTEPTYTPLHRDPNPNLFCQLHSEKVVRLLPPTQGEILFFEVQVRIDQNANSRIRTAEMMEGSEREALHDAVWKLEDAPDQMCEVALKPGDALFIPQGWWHSVKSVAAMGDLNASVNWWFR